MPVRSVSGAAPLAVLQQSGMAPTVEGFWGRPTSTLDWCEANYVVSDYIAEFCECLLPLSLHGRAAPWAVKIINSDPWQRL